MKLKWTSLTPQQEKKSGAIALIGAGLFGLLRGPGLLAMWLIPGAEDAPSFGKSNMQLMVAGGVMLIVGAAMAWHAWARPTSDPIDGQHDELAEAHRHLVQEFQALSKAPFNASGHRTYLNKLAEHLEALRRHLEALRRRP